MASGGRRQAGERGPRALLLAALREPAYRFAVPVVVVGAGVVTVLAARGGFAPLLHPSTGLLVFAALTMLSEFVPIRLPMQTNETRTTTSSLFAFAVLVVYGTGPAVATFVVAVVIQDLWLRLQPIKTAFNGAQYAISMAAAGAVLGALSDLPAPAGAAPLDAGDAPALVLAGATLFLLNHLLSQVVSALALGGPVRGHLRQETGPALLIDWLLLSCAPVVIVVAHYTPALLPLVGLPFAAMAFSGREAERRRHDALHDALTGLPNRTRFLRRLEQELALTRHTGASVGMMLLDLDRFKEINDALGHGQGDLVLRQVAARLMRLARPGDLVARLSGDEFGVLVVGAGDDAHIVELARGIRAGLEEPVLVAGLRVSSGASIGVAAARGGGAETLVRHADVAMFEAKGEAGGVALYDPARDPHGPDRLALMAELREGIDRGELVVHYQPKLGLAHGGVDGVEALVRWQHPERGLLAPAAFIDLAEGTELMGPLTMRVLEHALAQAAEWRRTGLELSVAVNLSAQQLLDHDLPATIEDRLAEAALPACALRLEITEGSLMRDPVRCADVLGALTATGIRVAIDDFGTGWSSLALLQRLPVHEIKVDRSFVSDMTEKASDAAIVQSTIQLAHALGLTAVAEGVETDAALGRLRDFGCDQAQGYLISRPLPAGELTAWLAEREPAIGGRARLLARG